MERTLQILINTLSFARVGAFALAHAGLSSAIVALMSAADNTIVAMLVLVVGNAVVIVLEGLADLAHASRAAETALAALRRVRVPGQSACLAPRIGVTRLPGSIRAVSAMFAAREALVDAS